MNNFGGPRTQEQREAVRRLLEKKIREQTPEQRARQQERVREALAEMNDQARTPEPKK